MDRSFFVILGQVSSFAAMVPLIFSLFGFNRFSQIQRRIVFLLIAIFCAEMLGNLLWRVNMNNNWVYHFYAVIEFLLILKIYQLHFIKFIPGPVLNFLLVGFVLFSISNAIWFQGLLVFNSNVTLVAGFFYLLFALIYFFSLLREETLGRLDKDPLFWFSMGVLIYYATNSVLFFINQYPELQSEYRYTLWGMHATVNILLITFYFIALWIREKRY